jgi:hypothetical protein
MMERHKVYFYEEDSARADPIAEFVKSGLEGKERVIVIATEQRRAELKTRLLADNVIGLGSVNDDHYVTLDASTILSLFLRASWPDERLFFGVVGQMVGSTQRDTGVRIYQEITAVVLASRDYLVALEVERLWAKLIDDRKHALLCGYPASAFTEAETEDFLTEICACHSESIGRDKCKSKAA